MCCDVFLGPRQSHQRSYRPVYGDPPPRILTFYDKNIKIQLDVAVARAVCRGEYFNNTNQDETRVRCSLMRFAVVITIPMLSPKDPGRHETSLLH